MGPAEREGIVLELGASGGGKKARAATATQDGIGKGGKDLFKVKTAKYSENRGDEKELTLRRERSMFW